MNFTLRCSRAWIYYLCLIVITIETKIAYNTLKPNIVKSTTYNPQVKEKLCLLKPDEGPCRGNINMYYFDPSIQNCSRFKWGGCQGNGNRFDSRSECLMYCLTQPDPPLRRPKWCSLSFDYGFCFGSQKVWHYDSIWKVCKERIYSGCGGNRNNFYNLEQCANVCLYGTYDMFADRSRTDSKVKKQLIINPWQATKKESKTTTATRIIIENGTSVVYK